MYPTFLLLEQVSILGRSETGHPTARAAWVPEAKGPGNTQHGTPAVRSTLRTRGAGKWSNLSVGNGAFILRLKNDDVGKDKTAFKKEKTMGVLTRVAC